jgi:Flp pilus assembly protein TadG
MVLIKTKGSKARRCDRRGAALVECAIVLPLLILITLGAIDAGQYVNVGQVVTDASREGARRASRNTVLDESDVESAVQDYFADAFPGVAEADLNAGLTVNVFNSAGSPVTTGDLTAINSGDAFSVQVTFEFDTVQWIGAIPMFSGQSVQTTTQMRRN